MADIESTSPKRALSPERQDGERANSPDKKPRGKLRGYEFWRSIGSPKTVCAPMVDQSELAFRLLCKKYGTDLCYTPMFHSRLFATEPKYRSNNWQTCPEDTPVVVQFCGDDPQTMANAAAHVHTQCAAVDINLGCPQGIARKGHYGSFLLTETNLLEEIVRTMDRTVACPVTCKIRKVSKEVQDTMHLVYALEAAGCSVLTVHGRTKEEKGQHVREADWETIKLIKQRTSIPVVANGGIGCYDDYLKCMEYTGVDAVMSSEALLEYPALFSGKDIRQDVLATEYLDIVDDLNKRGLSYQHRWVKKHLFTFLYAGLQYHTDLRSDLGKARDLTEMKQVATTLKERREAPDAVERPDRGWYMRYRNPLGEKKERKPKEEKEENAAEEEGKRPEKIEESAPEAVAA